MFHVLAYGGVPLAASLGLWAITALVLGPATFMDHPPAQADVFPSLLLDFLSLAHGLLIGWSDGSGRAVLLTTDEHGATVVTPVPR